MARSGVPAPRPASIAGPSNVKFTVMSEGRRLLVVDDDPFMRSVLGSALSTRGWTVTVCAAAAEAVSFATTSRVDAALLELELVPGPDGVDLAVALRRHDPLLPIVILTSYQSPQLLDIGHGSLPVGVRYVMKSSVKQLDDLDVQLQMAMRHPLDVTAPAPLAVLAASGQRLSNRQLEIMRCVSAGHGNAEIAAHLGMGEAAVEKAVSRLIRQLGLDRDPRRNKRVLVAQAYFHLARRRG